MRCQNMKRGIQVLVDKCAHSSNDMKGDLKVMPYKTAHTSNDMRHRTKVWWRSCSGTIRLMTENSVFDMCELGHSKTISITLHMACGRSCYGVMKAELSYWSFWTHRTSLGDIQSEKWLQIAIAGIIAVNWLMLLLLLSVLALFVCLFE